MLSPLSIISLILFTGLARSFQISKDEGIKNIIKLLKEEQGRCSLRFNSLDTDRYLLNPTDSRCQEVREINPYCRDNLTVAFKNVIPYSFKKKGGKSNEAYGILKGKLYQISIFRLSNL